ncbi:hypothetical protein L6452_17330 [Arctium lappa]|uniref:Uncharacterized protein n=1 Tax=Arctium lappa TaxID=4217 RepID=A0ACB9C331_ARCLA|nr:hypothetical protein L6452_17330 [Arctium lappa]
MEDAKKKGKEKMVESEQPLKKKNQIELDEEVAKQLQAELAKEEEIQSAKDRELALDMAKKLNEEYQKSLKDAAAAKIITKKASRQRLTLKQRQRQPSKTFLANQERMKMINFLKGALRVPEGMFTNMAYGRIEELYSKEMAKLQGDSTQREEAERRMKERHDLNIQQPFPESEETTPSKEKAKEKKEEPVAVDVKSVKRVKTLASKKQSKKPRVEEAEKEAEPSVASQSAHQSSQSNVQFELYMTVTDSEPVKANPISV